jgi:nitrite reductase/ring-hydroxylating ferredoxin subunit
MSESSDGGAANAATGGEPDASEAEVSPPDATSAQPLPGVELCPLSEINNPGSRAFEFRSEDSQFVGFVVRRGDEVHGFVDWCPHAGWRLSTRGSYLNRTKDRIFCSGHRAEFEFGGMGVIGRCVGLSLVPWPVAVVDGVIYTA